MVEGPTLFPEGGTGLEGSGNRDFQPPPSLPPSLPPTTSPCHTLPSNLALGKLTRKVSQQNRYEAGNYFRSILLDSKVGAREGG